ncbi:unnamed protein product, partial [Ixodes persulcatus]
RDLSKLSYFHKPGKEQLLTWTVGDVIESATERIGDTTAVVYSHQNISKTYTEYRKDIDQLAASLVSLKLPVGSRVAILAPRLYEGAQLLYAASKAGLVMVGINTFCTVSELHYCLNKTECAALILAEKYADKNFYEMLLQIAPEMENSAPGELKSQRLPFLKHVITIGDTRKPGSITFDDLINSGTAEDHVTMNAVSAKVQFDRDAFIQFSSGTTGQPKPARLSHFNVVNNANIVGRFIGYHQQPESICLNGELIYGFGRTLGVLAATLFGCTVVMPGLAFSPKATLETITNHRCTMAYASPSIFFEMMRELDGGSYDVTSLRKGLLSGSLCNADLAEKARTKLNVQSLYIMYGSTETSPIFTSTNPDEPTHRWIRTVGTPLDHVEVRANDAVSENVVEHSSKLAVIGQASEICYKGLHRLPWTLVASEELETCESHRRDEGTMSEDGRITFVGRIKEMISYKDLNVPPLEVENVLNTHPDVEEAQVIGVPDETVVEKVCAWIKLQPDKHLTHEDIKAFCKDKMQWFMVPEYVLFVKSFPRTQTGKVQKHKMREESVRLLTQ